MSKLDRITLTVDGKGQGRNALGQIVAMTPAMNKAIHETVTNVTAKLYQKIYDATPVGRGDDGHARDVWKHRVRVLGTGKIEGSIYMSGPDHLKKRMHLIRFGHNRAYVAPTAENEGVIMHFFSNVINPKTGSNEWWLRHANHRAGAHRVKTDFVNELTNRQGYYIRGELNKRVRQALFFLGDLEQ